MVLVRKHASENPYRVWSLFGGPSKKFRKIENLSILCKPFDVKYGGKSISSWLLNFPSFHLKSNNVFVKYLQSNIEWATSIALYLQPLKATWILANMGKSESRVLFKHNYLAKNRNIIQRMVLINTMELWHQSISMVK